MANAALAFAAAEPIPARPLEVLAPEVLKKLASR